MLELSILDYPVRPYLLTNYCYTGYSCDTIQHLTKVGATIVENLKISGTGYRLGADVQWDSKGQTK